MAEPRRSVQTRKGSEQRPVQRSRAPRNAPRAKMIVDGAVLPNGHHLTTGVCILGAGPAGLSVASECLGASFDVCVVESGDHVQDWRLAGLNRAEIVGHPYWSLSDVRARQFGGSANQWFIPTPGGRTGLKLRPLDHIDFENRPGVPHSGWPLSREDLDPYYRRAATLFGLRSDTYEVDGPGDHRSSDPLPLDSAQARTVLFQHASGEVFTHRMREAITDSGNVTAMVNATALELEAGSEGRAVRAVRVTTMDRKEFRVSAKAFVVALGGIENPRLMLLSNAVQQAGLGNDNDLLGRYFTDHPHFLAGALVPADPSAFSRSRLYEGEAREGGWVRGGLALAQEVIRRESLLNFCVSLSKSGRRTDHVRESAGLASLRVLRSHLKYGECPKDLSAHLGRVLRDLPRLSRHAANQLGDRARAKRAGGSSPRVFDLYHMAEQSPDPESRVTLGSRRDHFGQRRAVLDWKVRDRDIQTVLRGQALLGKELRRAGFGHIEPLKDSAPLSSGLRGGPHHAGTTRMSRSPLSGVVDENCKVHGLTNLFVAGSSVFPTSGFANPTLTIVALAIRLADRIKQAQADLLLK